MASACSRRARLPLALLALLVGCGPRAAATAAPPAAAPATAWTVPEGWKSETIPFPLDFAPTLAHRGVEELRFPPGFRDPGSPQYWSYAFAWRLDDDLPADTAKLAGELAVYFRGLVSAVDAETHLVTALDPARFAARVVDAAAGAIDVDSYDPFATGKPITLHVRVRVLRPCGVAARRAVSFAVSPAARDDDAAWGRLVGVADAYPCGPPRPN